MFINSNKQQLVGEDPYGTVVVLNEGDVITVDGSNGVVYEGINSFLTNCYVRVFVLCNAFYFFLKLRRSPNCFQR